jgi:Zn-dependent peptidase ImmA (M78 family)
MVAIEKGERRLKPEELINLASLYGKRIFELRRKDEPVQGLAEQLRAAAAGSSSFESLLPAIGELQQLCEDYVHLEVECGAPLSRRYPPEYETGGVEPGLAAEDVAASERSRLDLGEGPLVNLRETLEADVGLRIFQLELPEDVEGMYGTSEQAGACIAVNILHPVEKRRTSLAQEYAHFLTARDRAHISFVDHYERLPAAERFARAFARAFLMPAVGIRRRYLAVERDRRRGATYGDLCRLAHFYAVSLETATRRLEELRLLSVGTWDRFGRGEPPFRETQRMLGLEPKGLDDDPFPARYVALAVEAWQQAKLSEGQLARLLRTHRLGARDAIRRLELEGAGQTVEFGEPLSRATA